MSCSYKLPRIGVMMFQHQTRKIKPTRRSVSGVISYKKKPLAYESTLERDFIIYHAFRDDVKNITPQPIKIPFNKNGRTYGYTPDYYVELDSKSGKSFIAEVKPKQEWQLNWRDWSDKWKAAIRYCKEKGIRFIIFDEDRIRHEALDNINFLRTYETIRVTNEEVEVILADIKQSGLTSVDYILERYFKSKLYRSNGQALVWHLMANKQIGFDIWDDVKDPQMEVWYVGQ